MKVETEWLQSASAQVVAKMLEEAGHQALFVGGCVRNALLNVPVSDLDLATDARPDRVTELAAVGGLKAIPTGIDHGTVTVVAEGLPIEVTTFRRDVETDGRRAVVAFADTPKEDAMRRDFTMNALYCDRFGAVVDPLGGLPDLQARRLRFVGEAKDRVREDYLRILRFFRFHAWYADPNGGIDAEGLAACADGADGLAGISAERIGSEIKKLLSASDPAPAVGAMRSSGVLMRVLPGASTEALAPLVHLEAETQTAPDPMVRLASLTAEDLGERLRLSRSDTKRHIAIASAARDMRAPAALGFELGLRDGRGAALLEAALMGQPVAPDTLDDVARGAAATFPVTAQDLMPKLEGAALGARLKALKDAWMASDLRASKDELLAL